MDTLIGIQQHGVIHRKLIPWRPAKQHYPQLPTGSQLSILYPQRPALPIAKKRALLKASMHK